MNYKTVVFSIMWNYNQYHSMQKTLVHQSWLSLTESVQ